MPENVVREYFRRFPRRTQEPPEVFRAVQHIAGMGVLPEGFHQTPSGHSFCCPEHVALFVNVVATGGYTTGVQQRYAELLTDLEHTTQHRLSCWHCGTQTDCDDDDCSCNAYCDYCSTAGHETCHIECDDCGAWRHVDEACESCGEREEVGCLRCSDVHRGPTAWCSGLPVTDDDMESALAVLRHVRSFETSRSHNLTPAPAPDSGNRPVITVVRNRTDGTTETIYQLAEAF